MKELLRFTTEFWLLCLLCGAFYSCIFPFVAAASRMFTNIWKFNDFTASTCTGLIYDIALVFSIPAGRIMDITGRRLVFILTAAVLAMIANFILLLL